MPITDKIRQRLLPEQRHATGHPYRLLTKTTHLVYWHHQPCTAQGGKQRFAERTGVNYPLWRIQTFQRRQRFTVITKLAVVIIFNNPRLGM
ncbi:hypothetical protein SDC9_211109 [bioreactor metagenome]|uniref:Uncharacterized protein n=1 Tax=bioreactor metagenome TaxID=1076179 RepID=A0A645JIA6_9ZZZZ